AEGSPVDGGLSPFGQTAGARMPIREAAVVEVLRRRVQRNHSRRPAHDVDREQRGDLGVDEDGVHRTLGQAPPERTPRHPAGSDGPIVDARQPVRSAPAKRQPDNRRFDPVLPFQSLLDVAGVGDMAEGLLEDEDESGHQAVRTLTRTRSSGPRATESSETLPFSMVPLPAATL